jgi:hypothetical protein
VVPCRLNQNSEKKIANVRQKELELEKRLAHEERSGSKDSSQDGGSTGDETGINMIFMLPAEFRAPEAEVAEFALGANVVTIDKPDRLGQHMKPLFVKGYVEGRPV